MKALTVTLILRGIRTVQVSKRLLLVFSCVSFLMQQILTPNHSDPWHIHYSSDKDTQTRLQSFASRSTNRSAFSLREVHHHLFPSIKSPALGDIYCPARTTPQQLRKPGEQSPFSVNQCQVFPWNPFRSFLPGRSLSQ